ncbi:fimbria/pilus outer membrane usher protein [Vibrio sp. V12_P9A6T4]|uniref:fimbria/pilus outer membrane usher protein n=1 Tax=unclassified Vibrio TaxID=2614977 RepID=UPI000B8E7DC7|nr:fimbria/pilus outer membrane usher protein [Vibrio sp. V12_P9A6T4]OXX55556.1 fimbrial assembly protein [Vibrio sp. V12_P9A6T4]OXX72451.1 fimbrial assembly protein [Vibrio sp. V03_P4A6T147]
MKKLLSLTTSIIVIGFVNISKAETIEFNTDLLDLKDKESIESGAFQKSGYIMPGEYTMQMVVNNTLIGERKVLFYEKSENESQLCLTADLASDLGLKAAELKRLLTSPTIVSQQDSVCHNPAVLEGMMLKGELNKDTLTISVPQAYRDYISESWEPPSRWDNGVNGALLDYNINLQEMRSINSKKTNLSSYGIAGLNLGAWRLRANWQGRYQHYENRDSYEYSQNEFGVQRIYAHRALPEIHAKLMLGEQDLGNSIFDSFQFTGASLTTDDSMLPPNLRGYAPEVVGIAKTNAKVVISQQGRIIYETQVASGPFRIQDLSSSISGMLDVRVEEQDGSVQTFQVNTATIPYLSRPGSLRYKFNSGKVSSREHELDGPAFVSAEFSWGVNNGWSLLGGGLLADDYSALSVGVGRDLLQFGAISFDITESRAQLPEGTKSGGSYRVNYSKMFEQYDSQVAFAGYRFSERDFMTMNDFMVAKQIGEPYRGASKEMYSVVLSKQFRDSKLGAYVDYTHQSYWNDVDTDRISLSLSRTFDVMNWRNISAALSVSRNEQSNLIDNGLYLTLSLPFGNNKHVSYSASTIGGKTTNSMSFYNSIDERNSYSVSASASPTGERVSGFYTYTGEQATVMANLSHQTTGQTAVGLSVNGGITATGQGAAVHRVGMTGGSRIMVDTDGAKDVPVHAGGLPVYTNKYGKAVVADMSSYYRQRVSIDVDKLGENAEPIGTPISMGTLTEGAIGYRHFDMLSGSKLMLELVKSDGKSVPFATEVFNEKGQALGMVGEDGMAYLAGLHNGAIIEARWGREQYCRIQLPSPLPTVDTMVKLTCQ